MSKSQGLKTDVPEPVDIFHLEKLYGDGEHKENFNSKRHNTRNTQIPINLGIDLAC